MALNLYRRHGSHCTGGRALHDMTYESDELRRNWKRCSCPIYASGTLRRTFKRKNTERTTWEEAQRVVRSWVETGSWTGSVPAPAPAPPKESGRVTLASAMTAYLAVKGGMKLAPPTLRKYRTFCNHLQRFADTKGYVMIDQLTTGDIDVFYSTWTLGPRAKGKALGMLRSFFRFCARRKWVTLDTTDPHSIGPVSSDLKPPAGASTIENKHPFTDEELQRIMTACERMQPVHWTSGSRSGSWTGEDAKDFITFLTHTGLRISDAARFTMDNLRGNEVYLHAKKNGGDVFMWIPDWLRDRIAARSKRCGPQPFMLGESTRLDTVTDTWRRKLNKIFELAGKFDQTPSPHRFRHTFARILLERGIPVADVADLLGDDEDTVRKHYSRWVPERQARLTRVVQEAFADKTKPRIVKIR